MSGTGTPYRTGLARPAVLAAVLVFVLLAPVAFLFLRAYDSVSDRRTATANEIAGVAYLRALGHLTFTVADAQAAAVAGRLPDLDALNGAVNQVAAADERHGDTLRSHDRWSGVRAKIESIRSAPPGSPEAALLAYRETTDLLLALYGKVRDESGLAHDPDADAYHLQEGVAAYLPGAVIAAGRLADLAVLAATRPEQQRLTTLADLALARVSLVTAASRLIEGLRAAADDSESRTLGSAVLSSLDRFQLATDQLVSGAGQAGLPASDPSKIVIDRAEVQAAGSDLSTTILNEADRLLASRQDDLGQDRLLILVAGALVVLLALVAIVVLVVGLRRARATARLIAKAEAAPAPPRPRTGVPAEDQPAWGPTRGEALARWERSGASR